MNARNEQQLDDLDVSDVEEVSRPACPVCGGQLIDIRRKLCCTECHTIIETCCD